MHAVEMPEQARVVHHPVRPVEIGVMRDDQRDNLDQPQPERRRVRVKLIDEAIEQPGIGGQRQCQHELVPEIAALGEAVEAKGDGHQHGAHHEGAVGILGEL